MAWRAAEVDGVPCRIPVAWASWDTCAEAVVVDNLDRTAAVVALVASEEPLSLQASSSVALRRELESAPEVAVLREDRQWFLWTFWEDFFTGSKGNDSLIWIKHENSLDELMPIEIA